MGRTKAVDEPTAFAEIGTYIHRNSGTGKAKIATYSSVNKPLSVDAAEDTKQIKKVRVEVHVKEDKNVDGDKFYQKDVETIQVLGGKDNSDSDPVMASENPFGDSPVGDDFKKWTKNIIDKLIDAKNTQWAAIALSLVVGALGLGIALGR